MARMILGLEPSELCRLTLDADLPLFEQDPLDPDGAGFEVVEGPLVFGAVSGDEDKGLACARNLEDAAGLVSWAVDALELQLQEEEFEAGVLDGAGDAAGVQGLVLGGEEAGLGLLHVHLIIARTQLVHEGALERPASYRSGDAADDSDEDDGLGREGFLGAGFLRRGFAGWGLGALAAQEEAKETCEGKSGDGAHCAVHLEKSPLE